MRNTATGRHEPRSSASCAACKLLKRRCSPSCIFAPYFRSDDPTKFAKVHRVFGASNVSKILTQVPEEQREETVHSLAYEAEARLEDPVYGCIGAIASLQRKLAELQRDLSIARARLADYDATGSNSQWHHSQWTDPHQNLMSFGDMNESNSGYGYGDAFDQIIAAYGCDADASLPFQ